METGVKAYLITTGMIFGLVIVAHVLRVYAEGLRLARDPLFILLTVLTAGLCAWACALLRRLLRAR